MEALKFYFDFISPYAYLAWTQWQGLMAKHSLAWEPVPVLFAGLLRAHKNLGPAEIPAKRAYVVRDAYRKARALGLEGLGCPPAHPFNPLCALRVCSLPLERAEKLAAVEALFQHTWGVLGGEGIEGEDRVAAVLTAAGLNGAEYVRAAEAQRVKDTLRENTEQAASLGVFGVPSWFWAGELYWGLDAIPLFERALSVHEALPEKLLKHWDELPASAHRKR